ncbi:Uncharacterised protein [uncultured archaeon]|nr:Uncharacterised protein [uncultured archaeon]
MAKDMKGELRDALQGKSTVFVGTMETPAERIVYHIMFNSLNAGENVIWVCLKEPPSGVLAMFSQYGLPLAGIQEGLWFVDVTITGDNQVIERTFRCTSLDYVCLTLHVVNILKKYPRSLVMLDSIGMLAALGHLETTVRFIKYLDSKVRIAGGCLVTILANRTAAGSVESELVGLLNNVISVNEEKIHAHMGSMELKMQYEFSGSELILSSEDIGKDLGELFSLTPEEKKKLESEVEEKAHIYKELLE